MTQETRQELVRDLAAVLNSYSVDNDLNTPDFMLAEYVVDHLQTLSALAVASELWKRGKGGAS